MYDESTKTEEQLLRDASSQYSFTIITSNRNKY